MELKKRGMVVSGSKVIFFHFWFKRQGSYQLIKYLTCIQKISFGVSIQLYCPFVQPVLVDRLRPVLEEIIAAGRQQFQQPYKQVGQLSVNKVDIFFQKVNIHCLLLTGRKVGKPKVNTSRKNLDKQIGQL